jgi:predicted ester cyclase
MHESDIEARTALFYDAWNRGDRDAVFQSFAPDAVDHGSGDEVRDPSGLMAAFLSLRASFPDLQYSLQEIAIDSKRQFSVTNVTCEGTQQGEFHGFPPNNTRARWHEMRMARWHEGRVVEHWTVRDHLDILVQLGHIKL